MAFRPFGWTCPYCRRGTTVSGEDVSIMFEHLTVTSKRGLPRAVRAQAVKCPYPACAELSLTVELMEPTHGADFQWTEKVLQRWDLLPGSSRMDYKECVPEGIRVYYEEACAVLDASPRSAAALSESCLRGMIRDFWGITKEDFLEEVRALEEVTDPTTWAAVADVWRVEEGTASRLEDAVDRRLARRVVELLEVLIDDWYVARYLREVRVRSLLGKDV